MRFLIIWYLQSFYQHPNSSNEVFSNFHCPGVLYHPTDDVSTTRDRDRACAVRLTLRCVLFQLQHKFFLGDFLIVSRAGSAIVIHICNRFLKKSFWIRILRKFNHQSQHCPRCRYSLLRDYVAYRCHRFCLFPFVSGRFISRCRWPQHQYKPPERIFRGKHRTLSLLPSCPSLQIPQHLIIHLHRLKSHRTHFRPKPKSKQDDFTCVETCGESLSKRRLRTFFAIFCRCLPRRTERRRRRITTNLSQI